MRNETLEKLLDQFAARTPTPGGGGASALSGALGAALATMAANFTTGNEKFKAVEPQVLKRIEELNALRRRFLQLADEDVAAYGAYSAARALPKETPEQKATRSAAMKTANEQATQVPEQIVATAVEGLRVTEGLSEIVNPNLAGDVSVAAYLLEAAARGAGIQVQGNCAAEDADGTNAKRRAAIAARITESESARQRIDAAVRRMLKL